MGARLTSISNFRAFTGLASVRFAENSLTSFPINEITSDSFNQLRIGNNQLIETSVNNILIQLDNNGLLNGTVNLAGTNAAPTGAGLTAKTNLQGKGWSVTTN
jgi:hypothetical protein